MRTVRVVMATRLVPAEYKRQKKKSCLWTSNQKKKKERKEKTRMLRVRILLTVEVPVLNTDDLASTLPTGVHERLTLPLPHRHAYVL
jgi:hypothetical protein